MKARRIASVVVAACLTIVGGILFAGSRPPFKAKPMSPGGITGRTLRDQPNGPSCGQCHGSKAYGGTIPTVTIAGPTTLAAGAPGSYTIKTASATAPDNFTGIDVAVSDLAKNAASFGGLSTNDANAHLDGNEIVHSLTVGNTFTPAKTLSVASTTGYTFQFQMPSTGVVAGSARVLYGASAIGHVNPSSGFGWNYASNFTVVVPLGTSGPTSVTTSNPTSNSLYVSWSGGSAAAYQVNYKTSTIDPNNHDDGYKLPLTSATSITITGLGASTTYYVRVWGASEQPAGGASATELYSSNSAQNTGTTADPPPPFTYPLFRTGSLSTARFGHAATLLPNGKVLIAGGQNTTTTFQSAELYDPATGTFSNTGSMSVARSGHTATSLPTGKVLVTGGSIASTVAELYDPYTGTFTQTGSMSTTRTGHTATLLQSGKVLIAGGTTSVSTADVYDPSNGTFTPTFNMTTARFNHTATLLTNGKVLLAGGSATAGGTAIGTAEVYDPAGNNFAATANNLSSARKYHTATAHFFNAAIVDLVGGYGTAGTPLTLVETYDISTNSFTNTATTPYAMAKHTATLRTDGCVLTTGGRASNGNALDKISSCSTDAVLTLSEPRSSHTATLLADGRILIAGGSDSAGNELSSADLYDFNRYQFSSPYTMTGSFTGTAGSMTAPRYFHTATLLPNDKVLIAGGYSGPTLVGGCAGGGGFYEWNTAELYDRVSGTFTATTGNMTGPRAEQSATLLPNGKVLIAGGYSDCSPTYLKTAELYDPSTGIFTATGSMTTGRAQHTATLLANGKVLIAGGNGGDALASAEVYDPGSGTFSTTTGNMTHARIKHTATLLPNGKVFIAGGHDYTNATSLYTAELYDPNSGTFSASNATVYYQVARSRHTATLLPTGKVLVADGGSSSLGSNGSIFGALIYDPSTDDYGLTGCCLSHSGGRIDFTSTVLPDGKVVLIGGYNENGKVGSAEVYDPRFDFSLNVADDGNAAPMITPRQQHTATLLADGSVLVTGGYGATSPLDSAELFTLKKLAGVACCVTRPAISSAPSTVYLPAALNITGTGFRNDTEGYSGNSQSSPTDLPLLQLRRIDNEQIIFVSPSTRDATTFTSTIQAGLADGYYRVTVLTNAIPSLSKLVPVSTVALTAPTSIDATANSATSVAVTWSAVNGAASYEIIRTEDNVNYISRGTAVGTSFSDSAQSGKAYLYKVHAVDALGSLGPDSLPDLATTVIFNDDPVVAGATPVRALHITQLRTAVNAVRTLAGLTGGTFAETITAGSTTIKASHILELRSALTLARSTLGLSAVSYTDPSLTSGFTIKAAHINQLRNGVK